jgi:adenine-specific DNA glycosylase
VTLTDTLDALEDAAGPVDPAPDDGWEIVLRENVAYLVDDATRERAFSALRQATDLDPETILAAPPGVLEGVIAGMRPADRAERLRRCAELRLQGAPWKAYPGIGRPGVERIELFSEERAVLALESNGARVLIRLGYGEVAKSYDATYRSVQRAASAQLPQSVTVMRRAYLLLRRHGQAVCRRTPQCDHCAVADRCAALKTAAKTKRPILDPFEAKA